MENPGFCHIGGKILKCVNFQSLLSCRLVRKSWNNLLEKMLSKIEMEDIENIFSIRMNQAEKIYCHQWKIIMYDLANVPVYFYCYLLQLFNDKTIDFHKLSLLEVFIKVENLRMVEFMLTCKLMISPLSQRDFWNGFDYAAKNGQIEILQLIYSLNPKSFQEIDQIYLPIIQAIKTGHIEVLKFLMENIPEKHFVTMVNRRNLIKIAAEQGPIKILQLFKSLHPNVFQMQMHQILEPIMNATKDGHLDLLKFLVESISKEKFIYIACNRNIPNIAAEHGQLEILKYLCHKIPTPIVTDNHGNTPIHFSARNGHFEIVKFLTFFSSNPNSTNYSGMKPSRLAKLKGYANIEKYLVLSAQKKRLKILEMTLVEK